MGNTIGKFFRVTTFGEAHGPAMGVVIDGCPSGVEVDIEAIEKELARDVPDKDISTTRLEPNRLEVLSGIFEGKSLGTPIAMMVKNVDVCSDGYKKFLDEPRPGHGDFTYQMRYSHTDWRGGSRASGRECISRLMAGALAKEILHPCQMSILSLIVEMAGIPIKTPQDYQKAKRRIIEKGKEGDSTGGIVKVIIRGVQPGVGAPVFDKLQAQLAHALLSIGGVKSFEVGLGKEHAALLGSQVNDSFILEDGRVKTETNSCGGIQAGISNGMDIELTLAVKPPPSIRKAQKSVNLAHKRQTEIKVEGRFDLNFTPRVAVVAEAMTAIVLVDNLIESGFIHPTRFEHSPVLQKEGLHLSPNLP